MSERVGNGRRRGAVPCLLTRCVLASASISNRQIQILETTLSHSKQRTGTESNRQKSRFRQRLYLLPVSASLCLRGKCVGGFFTGRGLRAADREFLIYSYAIRNRRNSLKTQGRHHV